MLNTGIFLLGRGAVCRCGGCGRPLYLHGPVKHGAAALMWDLLRVPGVSAGVDPDEDGVDASWTVYACSDACAGRVNRLDGPATMPELMVHAPDPTEVIDELVQTVAAAKFAVRHPEHLTTGVLR